MSVISNLHAREILDSRGNPTVEVDLVIDNKFLGRASVPSGASTGSYEAIELRDEENRYGGKGVLKAINNVNDIINKNLSNKNFDQNLLDTYLINLDGTENKSNLGANAILGVSMAFAKAQALCQNIPLYQYFNNIGGRNSVMRIPVPMMNILNGGKHAENSTDLQEFMIMPIGAPTFKEGLRYGAEIFHNLKKLLNDRGLSTGVGDEGGFAPSLGKNSMAIDVILEAIDRSGYVAGKDIFIAIDGAASEFYEDGKYNLKSESKFLNSDELIEFYIDWANRYPIVSMEDVFDEDDWSSFQKLTERIGDKVQIVGDDLFVTNVKRLERGIRERAANSILIKVNQIGTISESINAINMATDAGFTSIVSHRSGETEDTTISDLVVGLGTGQIKTGSLSRSERIAKYNQLLRIEEELGNKVEYAGINALKTNK
ncbi:MAG: phosphopyruvate hydratase [bacterium]